MAIKEYFKLEIFSLLISVFVVLGCTALANEVEAILDKFGYLWLMGAAYIFIGYSAQSILVFFMGKAGKVAGLEAVAAKESAALNGETKTE
ncbi:MAG TPA: hypothetical protein ACFYEK_01375 [Candidatus Wunengus sp. YC60]|uniref:hypothetical protein n=1 Tax=Candidatus Wunengus sp. YC60 TaxID=3367697 RepID=UPI0040250149